MFGLARRESGPRGDYAFRRECAPFNSLHFQPWDDTVVLSDHLSRVAGRRDWTVRLLWDSHVFGAAPRSGIAGSGYDVWGGSVAFLGVHYPTDVIAGYLVAIAWTAVVAAIYTHLATKET
jgi:hypothetical protein